MNINSNTVSNLDKSNGMDTIPYVMHLYFSSLRIGNLVYRKFWNPNPINPKYENEISVICSLKSFCCNLKAKKTIFKNIKSDGISYVQITDELLYKLGLEFSQYYFIKGFDNYSSKISLRKEGNIYRVRMKRNNNQIFLRDILYVHELQNIFHALSGEELVYSA